MGGAACAQAQQPRPVLQYATPDALGDRCLAHAEQAGHAVAVAVFDHAGDLLGFAHHPLPPTSGETGQWTGRSATPYRRSTRESGGWNIATGTPHPDR